MDSDSSVEIFQPLINGPDRYAIVCGCGRVHEGDRTESPLSLVCEDCSEQLLILPKSAWPEEGPLGESGSVPTVEFSEHEPELAPLEEEFSPDADDAADDDAALMLSIDEMIEAEEAEAEPMEVPVGEPIDADSKPLAKSVKSGAWAAAPAAPPKTSPKTEEPDELPVRKRSAIKRYSHWIAGFSLLAAIAVGIAIAVNKAGTETDEETFARQTQAAEEAIENRDFATAETALLDATAAADRLGWSGEPVIKARRRLREVTAINHLLGPSLFAFLEDAGETIDTRGEQAWRDRFEQTGDNRHIVMMAPVWRGAGGEVRLELPFQVGGRRVDWEGEFNSLHNSIPEGETVSLIFGAKIADLDPSATRWEIQLEEVFLWRDWRTLSEIDLVTASEWDRYATERLTE